VDIKITKSNNNLTGLGAPPSIAKASKMMQNRIAPKYFFLIEKIIKGANTKNKAKLSIYLYFASLSTMAVSSK
jgi:hypothetical protein